MGLRELLIVIAIVAVVVATNFPDREASNPGIAEPTHSATPVPDIQRTSAWSVHGVKVLDSTDSLIERFGAPLKDTTSDDVRFTILKTPSGEIRRTEFLADHTAGVSGTILEQNGEVIVSKGDTLGEVKKRLGEPILVRTPDDSVSYQYEGARIYFRDDIVFAVVIEGSI